VEQLRKLNVVSIVRIVLNIFIRVNFRWIISFLVFVYGVSMAISMEQRFAVIEKGEQEFLYE